MRFAAPPTFDPTTEAAPWFEQYANVLLDGLLGLMPILFAAAAAFVLLAIGVNALRKYVGTVKPDAIGRAAGGMRHPTPELREAAQAEREWVKGEGGYATESRDYRSRIRPRQR